ncbi:HNH endonuclease signature motif containing protein [Streptomyces sp. ok210]|uniref:HNH endonuclease signature motif containing protein n=1 Tax=Streptomyces sp. ok210 TaxID=1761905 RepID=UPI0008ED9131|nr:HNH endonuclease signature motif containing protein [Streptomyces sp. ok210]SFS73271.1 5-methylcytosine-specific restriction enzyme A [Streptomyces sp. ok210]
MADGAAGLIKRVGGLAPAARDGGRALHRPLLLLWAIGQAVQGRSEHRWSTVRDVLVPLLTAYAGAPARAQSVVYPFWALRNNHLWEVAEVEGLRLTSGGRRPTLTTLNEADPLAGLPKNDFDLLSRDTELAARITGSVILRFFDPLPAGLLDAVGLTELLVGRVDTSLRPRVGEPFTNRDTIADAHGGNRVLGITPLADGILTAYSDDQGPYADKRIDGTDWIAYTGDGLSGDQQMRGGNKSMQRYRTEQRALRYWHKPHRGQWTFQTWAVIVDCHRRWGRGEDGQMRREYAWVLAPVASPLHQDWPQPILDALREDDGRVHDHTQDTPLDETEGAEVLSGRERYRRLSAAAGRTASRRSARSHRTEVERYFRSPAARQAVILRSGGTCENPRCLGHPEELTDAGAPILEVDHVNDLGNGGGDIPETMIALCPNCHALKTRGRSRRELQAALLNVARERHRVFIEDML